MISKIYCGTGYLLNAVGCDGCILSIYLPKYSCICAGFFKLLKDGEANAEEIDIFDITTPIAVKSAEISARYNIRSPAAVQIATAFVYDSDYFLPYDPRLNNLTEIKFLLIEELL